MLIEAANMEHVMKMVDYVEEGFLIPIVLTDQYNTNSKLLLSRDSLAEWGNGAAAWISFLLSDKITFPPCKC
jgi:hypothetical protein